MTIHRFLASIIIGALLCLTGYQAALAQGMSGGTNPYAVDCNKNGSINQALATGHRVIEFTGTCVEDVFTDGLNQLEIRGSGPRAANVIVGVIEIAGPTSLRLANFEVSGSDGVILELGVTGTATDIKVDGVLAVRFGSNMILSGIEVAGSVNINHNSWARLRNNDGTVSSIVGDATDQALQILQHSSALIDNGTTIVNSTPADALVVANGSRGLMNGGTTSISGGVAVNRASSFEVRNGTVASAGASPTAMAIASHSLLSVRPTGTYVGNINVSGDSAIMNERSGTVIVVGDVLCADLESSKSGAIAPTGADNCSGF